MTLSVVFRRAAIAEFEDAADWYESERSGLGEEFSAELNTAIAKAVADPGLYQFQYGDVRGVAARRFPYVVYFRVRDDKLVVFAVFHSSRDPAIWQRRL